MSKWKKIENIPETIYTIALGFDPHVVDETSTAHPRNVWLLGTDKGLWRIADGAAAQIAEPLKEVAITAVAYSKRGLYVGAADGLAFSRDDGATWTQSGLPKQSSVVQFALPSFFAQTGLAYAVTLEDGLLRTVDIGISWNTCNFGLIDKEAVALALSPEFPMDMTLVAAMSTGVFRSGNAGNAWREVPMDPDANPMACLAFARGMVVAGSENAGLFYSKDKGETWFKRNNFSSGVISALATSPDATKIAVATPQVVAVSNDLGETWTRAEGKTPKNIIALAVGDDGQVLCGTQHEGLWVYPLPASP
jgi:photosystem II stability/assembly factor-like uncharacterized protein